MNIQSYSSGEAIICPVKYSSATFTVDVESNGEKFPIDVIFEYRTVIGYMSEIVRIDFTVAFDTVFTWNSDEPLRIVIKKEIDRVFKNETEDEKYRLLNVFLDMVENFSDNIINVKE